MQSSRQKLHCLVAGYLRRELFDDQIKDEGDYNYEENLSNIIVEYLLLKEYFAKHDPKRIILSDDKLTIQKIQPQGINTCYGSIKIPSKNESKHHWIFKIIKTGKFIAIGIDETKYKRIDRSLYDKIADCKGYGIWSDGDISRWDVSYVDKRGVEYKDDDTVEMILDLQNKCISIKINEEENITVIGGVTTDDNIEYCMAVSLSFEQTSIKLCNYYQD